jgi:hypothetical protein
MGLGFVLKMAFNAESQFPQTLITIPTEKISLPMIGLPFPILQDKPKDYVTLVISISQEHHPQTQKSPFLNPLTLRKIDGKIDGFPAIIFLLGCPSHVDRSSGDHFVGDRSIKKYSHKIPH